MIQTMGRIPLKFSMTGTAEEQKLSNTFLHSKKHSVELKEMSFQNPFFVGATHTGQSSSIQSKATLNNIHQFNFQQLS